MDYLDKNNRKITEFQDYLIFHQSEACVSLNQQTSALQIYNIRHSALLLFCRATHKLETAGFDFRGLSFRSKDDDAKKNTSNDATFIYAPLHHCNP